MKEILETIIFIVSTLVPVALMTPAAWLIYKEARGAWLVSLGSDLNCWINPHHL